MTPGPARPGPARGGRCSPTATAAILLVAPGRAAAVAAGHRRRRSSVLGSRLVPLSREHDGPFFFAPSTCPRRGDSSRGDSAARYASRPPRVHADDDDELPRALPPVTRLLPPESAPPGTRNGKRQQTIQAMSSAHGRRRLLPGTSRQHLTKARFSGPCRGNAFFSKNAENLRRSFVFPAALQCVRKLLL